MTQTPRRIRAPEAVRTAVLDAALELFAQHGFADTSLRDISQKSGVSHPLILHHFGSKEALYDSVKRRVVEGYAQRFPAAVRATNRPISIRAEMKRILTYVGENELALRLCARTRVDGDFQVWPGEPDLLNLIRQRIEVAQQRGTIRDDIDAQQVSIMILGIVFFWLDNRQHFAQRLGSPISNDTYLNTAVKMIEEGLLPRTNISEKPANS
jgi:TetR/AcrR family transcriptional regulator